MAFSYTLNNTHHQQLFLLTQCKFHFLSHSRKLRSNSSRNNKLYPLCVVKFNSPHGNSSSTTNLETNDYDSQSSFETESGFSSLRPRNKRGANNFAGEASVVSPVVERELNRNKSIGRNGNFDDKKRSSSRPLSTRSGEQLAKKNENFVGKGRNEIAGKAVAEEKNVQKGSKKVKSDPAESRLRGALDMCSKRGDVLSAIMFYDAAKREGFNLTQYHYAVLLYLCSSAASGVLQPAKSGRSRTNKLDESGVMAEGSASNVVSPSSFLSNGKRVSLAELLDQGKKLTSQFSAGHFHLKKDEQATVTLKGGSGIQEQGDDLLNVNLQNYALQKGFEIYQKMQMENISMNEAILTAMARMAMAIGDGDMAFDMVKQMTKLGINPRLRSYGPAISAFCSSGKLMEAFSVEEHMLEHGVHPEEHELQALMNVSVQANRSDKVYYLLHKLRTSVRKVSPSTADLIRQWFNSKAAAGVGKSTWDERMIKEAIRNGGGGWHGQGWLGRGKWIVSNATIDGDGFCKCCGVKLETIDLDPIETENFAKSVASIAMKREKHSSFQNFQKWLDYYGPFEAVIDAANVGLHSQCRFIPSKIRAVINGIRQMLPSKKYPLIILHHKRVSGEKMDVAINKAFIEKWKCADALYATPTGSNDDWYWLYAAIKSKCLLVTNDEMRDHIFQLLGNDFFPKWKERHQVRYSFDDVGPIFHMPPPCSVVIQESESGDWHIPVESEHELEGERTWLCITRANPLKGEQVPTASRDEGHIIHPKDSPSGATKRRAESVASLNKKQASPPVETYNNLRTIVSPSIFQQHSTVLSKIMAAEEQSGCTIDFQI